MKKSFTVLIIITSFILVGSSLLFAAKELFSAEAFVIGNGISDLFSSEASLPEKGKKPNAKETTPGLLLEKGARTEDSLMLINESHPLPADYEPALSEYNGILINSAALGSYKELSGKIQKSFDNKLYVMSAFRTREEQLEIIESGNEYAAAADSSEHLSGLALDVYVKYHAGPGFLDSEEGQFVNSFCQDYGFIIRYPDYGEEITGISFEPWHLRYVGLPHSEIIAENRLTLEEYIYFFEPGEFYRYKNYFISRQPEGGSLFVPEGLSGIVISPDNTGNFIITGKYR